MLFGGEFSKNYSFFYFLNIIPIPRGEGGGRDKAEQAPEFRGPEALKGPQGPSADKAKTPLRLLNRGAPRLLSNKKMLSTP